MATGKQGKRITSRWLAGRGLRCSRKGVSLVEVTMALLILLIVFLALMQTALVSIGYNMNNVLRDEAVSIAELRMNDARSMTGLTSDTLAIPGTVTCPPVPNPATGVVGPFPATGIVFQRNLRQALVMPFCTNRTVTVLDAQASQVTITVGWTWKGQNFNHSFTSIVRQ